MYSKGDVVKRQGRTKTTIIGASKIDSGIRLIETTEILLQETRDNFKSELSRLGVKKSTQQALDRNLLLLKQALPLSTNFIKDGLKQTVSIGGVATALERKRAEEKRKLQHIYHSTPKNKRGKSSSMEQFEVKTLVDSARKFGKDITNFPAPSATITPLPKRTRMQQPRGAKSSPQEAATDKDGTVLLEYDLPSPTNEYNGRLYTPLECVLLLKRLPTGKERAALVTEWVRLKLIPCKHRQMRQYVKKHDSEPGYQVPQQWGKVGKPAIASGAALKVIFDTNVKNKGQTIGAEEIRKGLIKLKAVQLTAKEIAFDESILTVDPKTVKIYKATMALEDYSTTTTSTIAKTKRRFTAMNSVRNAMSFAATVISTHFIVGSPSQVPIPESMTDGAKNAMKAASELFGGLPVFPVLPELILSTDDITLFVCDKVHRALDKLNGELPVPMIKRANILSLCTRMLTRTITSMGSE